MLPSKKPLLLIFPFDLMSHYLRCIMLAGHLRDRYEIRFAHSERYTVFVVQAGYNTFPCKSFDAVQVMESANRFNFDWINEAALEAIYADQVRVLDSLQPVAVLGDTAPTLKMATEKAGVFYLSLLNGYTTKHYAYTRKLSRTHPVYKYINMLSGQLLEMLTQKGESLSLYKLHRPFKKLRALHQLSKT